MVMTLMTSLAIMDDFDTSQTKEITETFTGGLGENKEYKKSTKKGKMVLKTRNRDYGRERSKGMSHNFKVGA